MATKSGGSKYGAGGTGLIRTGTTNPQIPKPKNEDSKRIIGLGFDAGGRTKAAIQSDIVAYFAEAMKCSDPNYLPLVAQVEWQINGPMSPEEVSQTLGAQISILSSGTSVAGVQNVYTTPGLINGEFQTYNLVMGIGAHFRVDPRNFSLKGNAFKIPAAPGGKPVSSDDWTKNDAVNGALGFTWDGASLTNLPMVPAILEYNWWMAQAFAHLIKGANFRWTYGSLVNIFEDQLANTAFMPSMAQNGSSGASQIDAMDIVQRLNAFYEENGSVSDFLTLDQLRYGSANQGAAAANIGMFAGFDGRLVDVTYGGPAFQALSDACCDNPPYRMLRKPYLLHPGVPPGLIFEESNSVEMELFRRYMDITGGQTSGNVPPILTDSGNITAGFAPDTTTFTHASVERTLDNPPAFVAQQRYSGRAQYKYTDAAFMNIDLLGFEIGRGVAKALDNDPAIAEEVKRTCGCEVGWTQ